MTLRSSYRAMQSKPRAAEPAAPMQLRDPAKKINLNWLV
jgi:hypothetical protein